MKINTGQGTIPLITLIAIWSISAVISLPGLAVSPILGDLHTIFPKTSDLEIQMLTSLPSLLIIPFVLISGRLSVGRDKIKILILGLSLFFGSGILYFFAHSMTALIVISCLLGIGAGIMIPLSTGFIVDYFSGEYRVRQLGYSSAINNMTLVLATMLTGYLANFNWHYPFLVYTLPGGAIILSSFLRKSPPNKAVVTQSVANATAAETQDSIDRPKLTGLMLLYFFVTYIVLVISFYLPFLLQDYKMSSEVSGSMISLFFFAIMLPGFFLSRVIRTLRERTNIFSLMCMAVGLLMVCFFRDKFLIGIGCLLVGLGYGIMQPIIYDKTARSSSQKKATLALSFVMSVNYLAIMLCPFIVDMIKIILHTHSPKAPFIINAALTLIVVFFAYKHKDNFVLGTNKEYYPAKE